MSSALGSTATWSLTSLPLRLLPPARLEYTRRLEDALSVGIGLGARFDLEWLCGPLAVVRVATEDRESARWWERCVLPAYPSGRWAAVAPAPGSPVVERRRMTPAGPVGAPFPHGDPAPWSDAVLPALRLLPSGVSVHWSLTATALEAGRGRPAPELESRAQPPGFRMRPLTEPERMLRDRTEHHRLGPWWSASVEVRSARTGAARAGADRMERLLTGAATRGGGNALRRSRWSPRLTANAGAFLLANPELLGLLPAAATRWTSPSAEGVPRSSLRFAYGDDGDRVGLPVPAAEGRHAAVLGETGMGKSTALVALARAAASIGNVVLLDPIGDTGRRFLGSLSPEALDRVCWISPTESPVAVDLVASLRGGDSGGASAERALSEVVDALRRVRSTRYGETPFWGPRIEETVRRALAATAAIPGATLDDAVRLLEGVGRRPAGVPVEARAAVEALWARARERPEEVDGSRRLLSELTERPALRRLLGARNPRCRIPELLEARRLTVVTAEAGAIGEGSARYLLAVLLALLWSARLAEVAPPKTFFFLDEAQWYAHDSVAEMLRLGRRANLHLILATQALRSLPEEVAEAVRTNAADLLLFRGSPDDAREVNRWAPAVDPEQVLALPAGRGLALIGKGGDIRGFRLPMGSVGADTASLEAYERARAASRPRWPSPDESSGEPRETEGATADGSHPEPPAELRSVLLTVWAAVLDTPGGESVRLSLQRLRQAADPDGSRVREVGRRLHDSGLLIGSDRDQEGSYWELRRTGFDGLLGPAVDPAELREAAARWRGAAR